MVVVILSYRKIQKVLFLEGDNKGYYGRFILKMFKTNQSFYFVWFAIDKGSMHQDKHILLKIYTDNKFFVF